MISCSNYFRGKIGKLIRFLGNGEEGDKKRFKVAASIGSFGAHLCNMSEYDGSFAANYSEEQMASWHKELVSAFQLTKPGKL